MFTRHSSAFILLTLLSVFILTACSTTTTSQFDRELYLQSFLGKSSEYIYNNLDLTKMGYQPRQAPVLDQQQLVYRIERTLMIPMPMSQPTMTSTGVIPIPVSANTTQGYDASLQCQIVFLLKNNIAQSVTYTGRTC